MKRLTRDQLKMLKYPLPRGTGYIHLFDYKFLPCIGSGRHRAVFELPGGRHVIKVPLHSTGIDANLQEVRFSKIYPSLVARTRMFGQSAIQVALDEANFIDSRNLFPEELELYSGIENMFSHENKKWFDRGILQCGRNTRGQLVVYDCNTL